MKIDLFSHRLTQKVFSSKTVKLFIPNVLYFAKHVPKHNRKYFLSHVLDLKILVPNMISVVKERALEIAKRVLRKCQIHLKKFSKNSLF